MGCDIHAYIEYQAGDSWRSFGGLINPGRDYRAFCRLAGVRGDDAPLVPLRGMPTDAGWSAKWDSVLSVRGEGDGDEEGSTTRERAEKWTAEGIANYTDKSRNWITHPDWHSHTYLFTDEWAKAIDQKDVEYAAILGAMKVFENAGHRARVVFWFDN